MENVAQETEKAISGAIKVDLSPVKIHFFHIEEKNALICIRRDFCFVAQSYSSFQ